MRLMQSAGAFNPVNLHRVLISHANIPLMQSVMRNRKLLVQTGPLPLHRPLLPPLLLPSPLLSTLPPPLAPSIAMSACETRARFQLDTRVSSVFSICQENNNNRLCIYIYLHQWNFHMGDTGINLIWKMIQNGGMDFIVDGKIFWILENILQHFSYPR